MKGLPHRPDPSYTKWRRKNPKRERALCPPGATGLGEFTEGVLLRSQVSNPGSVSLSKRGSHPCAHLLGHPSDQKNEKGKSHTNPAQTAHSEVKTRGPEKTGVEGSLGPGAQQTPKPIKAGLQGSERTCGTREDCPG